MFKHMYIHKIKTINMRRIEDQNVRKIIKLNQSYATTLPIGIIRELKWQEGQKLVVEKRGEGIFIKDWKR